ncbi:MAG TPA: hypothetical protein ENL13_00950, partial [Thermoplasmatales archaeon]|nr:hypothetical protein [Thermoplasmatales archaeon]
QYIYESHIAPVNPSDPEEFPYYFGGGTPSDVIYGNIDPIPGDWSTTANDTYSYYPFIENAIGRITGWDAQDASALVVRTIFYDSIIDKLGDWKDNAALLIGGGQDFQKPLLRYLIFGDILHLTPRGEPMKYWTGYGEIAGERTAEKLLKPMGFNVLDAYSEEASREGFSDEALDKIKKACLLNRVFFSKNQVKNLLGEDVVKGGRYMENSNFIWANAHGQQHMFAMEGVDTTAAGFGGPLMHWTLKQIVPVVGGGFLGPGYSLSQKGVYGTRDVENMNLGPSFMWLESCICGKIDGMDPRTSIGQTFMHAGLNTLIAAPTESNIAGGYLEPKNRMYDTPFSVWRAYRNTSKNARNGEYPEPHFGYKIYTDLCRELKENDATMGLAFRNAKNNYLPYDANWTLWWSPPLIRTGDINIDMQIYRSQAEMLKTASQAKTPMLKNKYISFYEYLLFGDPAFNPYIPGE